MTLYLVERTDGVDYDEFDSFVIACETEDEARRSHPDPEGTYSGCWPVDLDSLKVTEIGTAFDGIRAEL